MDSDELDALDEHEVYIAELSDYGNWLTLNLDLSRDYEPLMP